MKEMLVYRYEDVIYAPIDLVFEYVDNDEKIKLWNTLFIENLYEKESDRESNVPGTAFKSVQIVDKKTYTIDAVLVEHDAPYKVVVESKTKEGTSITKYFLSREADGTRLIMEASLVPSNILYKASTKLFGWTLKYVYEEQFENLKRYIEEEAEEWSHTR